MNIFMQKNSKEFEYIGNYRHSLGGDDFALRPCTRYKCLNMGQNTTYLGNSG